MEKNVTASPLKPKEITGVEIAFGPKNIKNYLPAMKDIPERFHKHYDPYVTLVSSIFFGGGSAKAWEPKPGIDKGQALAHFRACLGSFEPKHEHKEAGCAYMLSEWFTPESLGIEAPPKSGEAVKS